MFRQTVSTQTEICLAIAFSSRPPVKLRSITSSKWDTVSSSNWDAMKIHVFTWLGHINFILSLYLHWSIQRNYKLSAYEQSRIMPTHKAFLQWDSVNIWPLFLHFTFILPFCIYFSKTYWNRCIMGKKLPKNYNCKIVNK